MAEREVVWGAEPPGPEWEQIGDTKWARKFPEGGEGFRVAVVGGGPGGLFTTFLLNHKLPSADLTLFEASGRLGGKVFTDEFSDGTPFEAGVAELYEYLGPGGADPLRMLIEDDLGLKTNDMSGGGVVLHEQVTRSHDHLGKVFGEETMRRVKRFHERVAELMPLEKYAKRWQPENDHPWARDDFRKLLREEIPDDPTAVRYVEAAVHSDLATEPHTCNGLNAVKNVLLDNDKYMQLYHVEGGIGLVPEALADKIKADVRTGARVMSVGHSAGGSYSVTFRQDGRDMTHAYDAVIVCLPNHWLGQVEWEDAALREAIHSVCSHYDLPAHYLRVSMLFKSKWWAKHKMPGEFWMMDMFNGCCAYDDSTRWGRDEKKSGHVLSFLLAGQDALNMCASGQEDEDIIEHVLQMLPDFMRGEAQYELEEAQVDRYVGAVNAQPGGWPVEELRGEHSPEPKGSPAVFLVGDYFFDSTLNAALISANTATDLLLEHLGLRPAKVLPFMKQLAPEEGENV